MCTSRAVVLVYDIRKKKRRLKQFESSKSIVPRYHVYCSFVELAVPMIIGFNTEIGLELYYKLTGTIK